MPDLMTQKEARLRELYDFENMKPMVYKGISLYSIEVDDRAFIFLNELITLDYRKLKQIETIYNLHLAAKIGGFPDKDSKVRIGFMAGKITFFLGSMFMVSFRANQSFEDLNFAIFNTKVSATELSNNFDYDSIYEQHLSELKKIISSNITTFEFFSTLDTPIEDLIKSKITDDSFRYVNRDEFIEKYSNTLYENEKNDSLIFNLKPLEIRNALKPFFSTFKLDEIVKAITLLAFYTIIRSPNLKFKDIKCCIRSVEHYEKFQEQYKCYTITIHSEEDQYPLYYDISLSITTDHHFISYDKRFVNREHQSFDGIKNLSKEIINDISGIFESNLGITRDEIDAKQLSLLLMMNS